MLSSAHGMHKKAVSLILLVFIVSPLLLFLSTQAVFAQTATPTTAPTTVPTPTTTPPKTPKAGEGETGEGWKFDQVVTDVGKNSERARELLYWTFSHPARNRAPVLAKMWSISRNIVYLFFLLVLAAGGIGYITARRQGKIGPIFSGIASPFFGFELPSFIFKVAALLLYVTFSYVFVLGLIEFAQILQNFFIKNLGGCNLFNINFGEATKCIFPGDKGYQSLVKSMEKNYTDFVGFREWSSANQEMANTSLFFIRLTTLTYNALSIMLILRDVILWLLLIVAPFLALFMPFIFIRNIGWIWIGVFMQWLFYGPLVSLFVTGLVKIWEAGIPYGFDFSRVGDCAGTPYKTSINILWGGPAQTLGQCNSANYIDTYAEYVVSLIMLWAAILLPWLLLRIFRDYCCDILRQNQATLQAIYNQLRKPPSPKGPKPEKEKPAGDRTKAMRLPFRHLQGEERKMQRETERKAIAENLREISRNIKQVNTNQIVKSLRISIESLRDVAQAETNASRRQEVSSQLNKIANPARIANIEEQRQYSQLKGELLTRAKQGDDIASRVIETATQPRPQAIIRRVPRAMPVAVSASQISQAAKQTQVSEAEVARVVRVLPSVSTLSASRQVEEVTKQTGLDSEKAQKVLAVLAKTSPIARKEAAPEEAPKRITVEDYEEVKTMWVKHYRSAAVPKSEKIKSRTDWLRQDLKKITNAINLLQAKDDEMKAQGLREVEKLLPFLLLGGFSDEETIVYLKAKLEAAKQVYEEVEKVKEAKEEAKSQEELLEVSKPEEKEEAKAMKAKRARKMDLPKEE
jgi:hypothetical protein